MFMIKVTLRVKRLIKRKHEFVDDSCQRLASSPLLATSAAPAARGARTTYKSYRRAGTKPRYDMLCSNVCLMLRGVVLQYLHKHMLRNNVCMKRKHEFVHDSRRRRGVRGNPARVSQNTQPSIIMSQSLILQ